MRAYESWLSHDNEDHDKFAAAATVCQNASGGCIWAGYCIYGDCFGQKERIELREIRKRAARLGYKLIKDPET